MYLDADDARSDFFLTAAIYVIGPTILSLLISNSGSVLANQFGVWLLAIGTPLLLNAAMPLYLMRYRGERWGLLVSGTADAIPLGLTAGAAVVVGTVLGDLAGGTSVTEAITGTFQDPAILTSRVLRWLTLALLTVFLYRRAEYAFRSITEQQSVLTQRAAIATVGSAVVATLLLLPRGLSVFSVLAPLGFGVAYLLATRLFAARGAGLQWQFYSPLIVIALGPLDVFSLLLNPINFLTGLRAAGMITAFALVTIMGLAAGKGGRLGLVMAAVIALLSSVTFF